MIYENDNRLFSFFPFMDPETICWLILQHFFKGIPPAYARYPMHKCCSAIPCLQMRYYLIGTLCLTTEAKAKTHAHTHARTLTLFVLGCTVELHHKNFCPSTGIKTCFYCSLCVCKDSCIFNLRPFHYFMQLFHCPGISF